MSRETDSKRKRKKMKSDPTSHRGNFGDLDTFERKTPTLRLKQERKNNKYKSKNWNEYED